MFPLFDGWLDLLAPPTCAGCDLPTISARPAFCDACGSLLEPVPPQLAPPAAAAALYRYQGPLADAIRRLKYGGRSDLVGPLGALLSRAAAAYAGQVDAVVPVPLHRSKLRARGWNPAALLAKPLARELAVPLDVRLLERVRATSTQAALAREARGDNVRGAFATRPRPHRPARRILLVDDVRTTGATLREAANALSAGGHDVVTLALAWAPEEP